MLKIVAQHLGKLFLLHGFKQVLQRVGFKAVEHIVSKGRNINQAAARPILQQRSAHIQPVHLLNLHIQQHKLAGVRFLPQPFKQRLRRRVHLQGKIPALHQAVLR